MYTHVPWRETVADAVFASMVAAVGKLTVGLHKLVASPAVLIESRPIQAF